MTEAEATAIIDRCAIAGARYAQRVGAADNTTALQYECGQLAGEFRKLAAENEALRARLEQQESEPTPEDGYAVDAAGTFAG